MENISLVAWDDRFVLGDDLAPEWTWLVDQINIHEMGHSYFGDLITCRDYAHAWLKESWATYCETLWLEHRYGADERDHDWYKNVQAYIGEADTAYKRPIVTRHFNHSWQMYDRHLYPGGAARLHMLRKELGDDTFFAGVRLYVKRFAFKVVETPDFRRAMEEVSGRSLVQWFDQWIHGKGYPSLKAAYAYDAKKGEASVTVEQTQENATEGVPVFTMPIDIGWVIDGELHVETVDLSRAKHTFVLKVATEPAMVRIDPANRSVMKLDFNPGDDLLRRQLTDSPDVVGRIHAANELCKAGGRRNVEAVRDAYRSEGFWGVRVRFAAALSRAASQVALDALADLLVFENDPMVLETLLRTAGAHRDAGIRAAIAGRLDAGIEFPRARMAALEALGMQREDAQFERLERASRTDDDRYGVTRSGALIGLAQTRSDKALEPILAATRYGEVTNRVRPNAARALGALGRVLEKPRRQVAADRLADLLRDPVDRVQVGAVDGIAALGESSLIGALTAYQTSLSEQTSVTVDRVIAGLRAAEGKEAGGARKQVEELEDKLRKLADRLDKLEARATADEATESR
jgi:aminopeptidase N